MNVAYINPFLLATKEVLGDFGVSHIERGKLSLGSGKYEGDNLLITVGVTGEIKGQAVFEMNPKTIMSIASIMMGGCLVTELDALSKSAASELTNMILGRTATKFSESGKKVDITPPTLIEGKNINLNMSNIETICIPLKIENSDIDFNLNLAMQDMV